MKRRFISVLVLAIVPVVAQAARFPDKVSKEFVIEGEAAIRVASALGMSTDQDSHLALPWKHDISQCYKGIGTDGKAEYGSCDPNPAPINVIKFSAAGNSPRLELYGNWHDGETGSLPDVPKYSFSSPLMKSGEDLMGWKNIAEKLGDTIARSRDKSIRVLDDDRPLLQIWSYETGDDIQYVIGIDDRPPAARMIAEKEYRECLEKLKETQSDSSC